MTTPNEQSSRELLPCPFCGGECDFCSTGVATPDHGDERRAIHEWLMREHKIEVLGNPEDDTAAVISLGTLRNIARVAMSAAQPVAQEAMRRDRETDRARFPDPEFNRWLDDSVADGVCVWDTIDDVHLAWIAWSTRDSYKSREAHMTVLDRDAKGVPTIWCDPEIADIVAALNTHGLKTVASCSGHGQQLGIVSLADGRELTIGTTAAREGVVHDWPACAVFRGGLCTCDAEDVAAKTGLDHFVADVEASLAAPQPSQGAEDFWRWLPKAYRDSDANTSFTAYNMEVAFEAGRAIPSDLEIQAVEELAQLGYTMRNGMLYPPKDGIPASPPQPVSAEAGKGVEPNIARLICDLCELERADLDDPQTIVVDIVDVERILRRHIEGEE